MPTPNTTAKQHGVTLTSQPAGIVHCDVCGKGWTYQLLPAARMPRRWWACPFNGCNLPG